MDIIFTAIAWMIILLFGVYGFVLVLSSFEGFRKGFQSKKWVATPAIVNHHKVKSYTTGNRVTSTVYSYVIAYTYSVDGSEYSSKGFDRGRFRTDSEAAMNASWLYPDGKTVNVFYNPKRHSESVSSKGLNVESFTVYLVSSLIGLGLIALSTAMLFIPILRIFGLSDVDSRRFAIPLLAVLPLGGLLAFSCIGLALMYSIIPNRSEPVASSLARFVTGGIIFLISMLVVVHMFSEPLALLVIGSKPGSGCYRPDFGQKQWLPIPCPPPRESGGGP
jgi:Protein of unknown function (DUF3592)